MLGNCALVAFATTANLERAMTFYQDTLGLKFLTEDPAALVFEGNGTMLRLAKVARADPAAHTILGWMVPDIGEYVGRLLDKGVVFKRYDGMGQDDLGICTFPGGGRAAWFQDPDGNVLSLTHAGRAEAAAEDGPD